ncbi:MAG: hypothetical protein LBC18_09480 [Opitutaceae bacterium]|jgi:curli biogenesis system outer membrane secretion channel CsgG|nr:hypothetical protein [Opitutaceae bacterium]
MKTTARPAIRLAALPALGLLLLASAPRAAAQTAPAAGAPDAAKPKVVAVSKIKVLPAVAEAAARKKISMDRVAQSLDSQLVAALQATRKYEIVARSDAGALVEEAAATGRAFSFGDADYLLVATVDDFQDVSQTADFGWSGKATRRIIRLSTVAKIYDAKTGKINETANFQETKTLAEEKQAAVAEDGDLSDSLLVEMSRGISEKIAGKVVDIGYPARVIGITGAQITISRGEGSGIAVGQMWEIFATGETLVDPDTGAVLGAEEISVGKIRITRVTPKFSVGKIEGENLGIAKLNIVRLIGQ